MEYINATQISPLISHCQVKVCYVGQTENRNGTVITKETAREMGKKLPGSPVVGYFDKETNDFDGHTREIVVDGGKFEVVEKTKPYGFVPTNAKVWFEKFNDDGVEHEYLVTECYLWTGAYPECKRVVDEGNNQSMELNKENQVGSWSISNNSGKRIFIYNEALIEKLCILGQNIEPCFEGAQITAFSLNTNEFMREMYSMITELQDTLNKGGSQATMEENKNVTPGTENQDPNFACGGAGGAEDKKKKEYESQEEDKKKKEEENKNSNSNEGKDEDKKKQYNLEDVVEYATLKIQYATLQSQFSALQQEKNALDAEIAGLRQFKLVTERQNKQAMIDSFYMLNDEDKKDVVEHMDTYSVEDIEAKLSVICVRNKVDFNLNKNTQQSNEQPQGLFNLNGAAGNDTSPEWLKAVRATAHNK